MGMGELNNGENKVFPIQVSHQELLLFLCVVIVIAMSVHSRSATL
jgi:hypothetical protein